MERNIKMADSIERKVKALEKKRDLELKKIKSEYDIKINEVIADYRKDDSYGDYELKFDLKKQTVEIGKWGFTHNCKPCNKWSKKSDWFKVKIEDYDVMTTYTDCGYGDDDESAMFRTITTYDVCPKCGRMIHISTEKFESGESKNRYEDNKGFDIRPLNWVPKVKIIGRKKTKNK